MGEVIKFKHPFTSIISGPTGSGMTSFCVRCQEKLDTLCDERRFDGGKSILRKEYAQVRRRTRQIIQGV
jgi:hypothetical protein